LWDLPIVRTPKLDSAEYVSWARRLAAGDFAWPIVSPHGPGYPLLLAALFVVGSGSLKFAIACQAIAGAITATLIALIAREAFGDRPALFAGLCYALYAPAVYIDTALLSEGLLLFLLTVALFVSSRSACLSGVAFGAATLVRPTAIVFAMATALWMARRVRLQPHGRWRPLAVFAAACAIVIAPAIAKNYSVAHSLSLQGYGGVNVYIGNSPLHTGRPTVRLGAGWDALNAEAARAGVSDPNQQDRYYVAKTLTEIRQHPAGFAKVMAAKALWLVQAEEVRDSHSFYFFSEQSPLLRVLPRWAILFPLACVGAIGIARLRPRAATLLAYYTLAAVATTVGLVVGTRYRMPLVPAMAIAAGVGIHTIVDGARQRRARDLAIAAAVIVVAVAISHARHDPRNTNVAEEWALTGSSLISEHDLTGATNAYRHALLLDPNSGLAWDGLGLARYDNGQLTEARQSISRALAIDPENGRAYFHLGLVDEHEGKWTDAAARYRRAAELSPYDAEAMQRLATALGMTKRPADARDAMRRVVELDPMNGEAWLDLCLLSLDLGDVAGASAALQRAEELGANPQKLAFASQALSRAGAPR
jgi:tetratricopeptide (TPR) repeat protein